MKRKYLERMGITSWQLREPEIVSSDTYTFFSIELHDRIQKKNGLVLADCESTPEISESDQRALLQKIIESITPYFSALDYVEENKTYDCVILLGKGAQQSEKMKTIVCDRVIHGHSLCELIVNAEYKRQLWSHIKILRDLFHA